MTEQDRPHDLRVGHTPEPLGIAVEPPCLSWMLPRGATEQLAYRIIAGDWDSGRVQSSQSVLVPGGGRALPRQALEWKVKVWTGLGESEWSEPGSWEYGLRSPGDWVADFITPDRDEDISRSQPAPYFRREFELPAEIVRARLYISALGIYRAEVNGLRIGEDLLRPGWTSYRNRLCYQTYDVTAALQPGANAIGVVVADGWARGNLGFQPQRNRYTEQLALVAQLEVTLGDGSLVQLSTDRSWRTSTGPVLAADLYNGETYDARLEMPGWSAPGFDDSGWAPVRTVEWKAEMVAPAGPPVRRMQTVAPVELRTSPSGKTIIDFGQNLVGWLRIRVSGKAGQQLTLRHAELLEGGELFTRSLRFAEATDRYTLKGGGLESWEPEFTFHGFRYAELEGWPGQPAPGDIEAIVCHSAMHRTGWFACSNEDVNRLHENIVWSLRGNFVDIPTDCPQRSERLGWTGDIQVFAPTAGLLYDVSGVLQSWLADLAADQFADGGVPHVVPDVLSAGGQPAGSAAGWADAAVLVPWALYQEYGDLQVLARQYESMRAWVERTRLLAGERYLWDFGFQFGDWLDPAAPPNNPFHARADRYLVATAYFFRSTLVLAEAAAILGRVEEAEDYAQLANHVRAAFRQKFAPSGLAASDSQAELVLALEFDLLPPGEQAAAVQRLVELVVQEDYRIGTGFLGTPGLCEVLSRHGRADIANRLLLQKECPSWLYPVVHGATTIWERWDAIQPDGSINPGDMLSFNHYAYGAIGAWLYGRVAGLQRLEPAWRRFRVAPQPGGGITWAEAHHETPFGRLDVRWERDGDGLQLELTVPPGTVAEVVLPGQETRVLAAGHHTLSGSLPQS